MTFLQSSKGVILALSLLLVAVNIAIFVSISHSSQQPRVLAREGRVAGQPDLPHWRLVEKRWTRTGVAKSIVPSSYTLTDISDLSITSLQKELTHCSLAMGVGQETLQNATSNLTTIATELLLFLNAIQSLVPQKFSQQYRNPCWYSSLPFTRNNREILQHIMMSEEGSQSLHQDYLYSHLLEPALTAPANTLLCLPFFFLAGFSKSGTTTLHSALVHHPMVASPMMKEPHWWTRMPLENLEQNYLRVATLQYLMNFYSAANRIEGKPRLITYDGSQSTLWDSNFFLNHQDHCAMPVAVSHILPRAKFIVMMRNPITRMYSHYLYSCSIQHGSNLAKWPASVRSNQASHFHQEVLAEIRSFNSCLTNSSTIECVNENRFTHSKCGQVGYKLSISLYHIHIQKWLQFFPREQFLFLKMEDMSREPHVFMRRVTDFLGISPLSPIWARRWLSRRENMQTFRRRKTVALRMKPETRALLAEFFRPYNEKLVELTGEKRFLWDGSH